MKAPFTGLLLLAGATFAVSAPANDVGFTFLEMPAGLNVAKFPGRPSMKISKNGRFVAGTISTTNEYSSPVIQAVKWSTITGVGANLNFSFNPPPNTIVTKTHIAGISADGSKVAGNAVASNVGFFAPIMWVGTSPIYLSVGNAGGEATDLSDDGTSVVGRSHDFSNGVRAFRHRADGVVLSAPNPNLAWTTSPVNVSRDGRYIAGGSQRSPFGAEPSAFRYDFTAGTFDFIRGPEGQRLGVEGYDISSDGATVVGMVNGGIVGQSPMQWNPTNGTRAIPMVTAGNFYEATAQATTQNGEIIVGKDGGNVALYPRRFNTWMVWTKTRGTRTIEEVLAEQSIRIPYGLTFTEPMDVTVANGLVKIVGLANYRNRTGVPIVVAFEETVAPGLPVDLNGTYRAARNSTVRVTTDKPGFGPNDQVQDVYIDGSFTPFSDGGKTPNFLQQVALRGKSLQFDVDLGLPSTWPNPSSAQEFGAGNAAEGKRGTAFVVRLADSNGDGPINLAGDNGLRLAFYRRDGRFWAHLKNQWYNQDLDIPVASDAFRYRVKVAMDLTGAMVLTITQLNGAGRDTALTFNIAGGSSDYQGTTSFSFLAEMINKTDAAVAPPTEVALSGFATTAVPDAMFFWTDTPYFQGTPLRYLLRGANLSSTIGGFDVKTVLPLVGLGYAPNLARYDTLNFFTTPTGSLSQLQNGIIAFGATGGTPPSLLDRHLAVLPFLGGSAGRAFPTFVTPIEGTPSAFKKGDGAILAANLAGSNVTIVDSELPSLAVAITQNCAANASAITAGLLTVTATAHDPWNFSPSSGLDGFPTLSVDLENDGTFEWEGIPLASANPLARTYTGHFNVPEGYTKVNLVVSVRDRSGRMTTSSNLKTITAGQLITTTLKGVQTDTPINRTMRYVLGGNPNTVTGAAPIVINKVVTFIDPDGLEGPAFAVGTFVATEVPSPASPKITLVYAKDPYHTLGARHATSIVGGKYQPISLTLIGGDLNNDNVVDNADIAAYNAKINNLPGANTALLANSAALIAPAAIHADISGNGKVDVADYNLIWPNHLLQGAGEPGKIAP